MAEIDELFGNEKQTTMEPFSKEDWIKQRNENRALAYEMLEKATEELNNPDSVMTYLDVQSRMNRYSVSNALLVAYQNPEATRLCELENEKCKARKAKLEARKLEKQMALSK